METSLLKTKLNVPPARPGLVTRPRLIEILKEGLSYSLVLVSAAAGFGKTTLLSEWARQSKPAVRTGWVSLDEGDNDSVRFWDYFIAALQTLQSGYGEKILPWLHSSQPLSTEPMLTMLINELSVVKGDFVIVLDDYHLIESQQIHDGITYLIEHLPTQAHMVMAVRADPPLPLARFRGKGMMLEIRTDDLRFNLEDTASLLKELKTPVTSTQDIAVLNERTEGWVVGLKMAALSMRDQKNIPGFISAFTGSQRYIMDYLIEEVLQKQSPELRDFLMKTSILERLTAPLCDALTGRRDSSEILLTLEQEHLFIVPLDESRRWYRYEHLFADLLRHQCETVYGKEQVGALHRQASQWYGDNDLPDEAIHHYLAARDWDTAIKVIYAQSETHIKRGEWRTLVGWLELIPDEILRNDLELYSRFASVLSIYGPLDAAEAAVNYMETVSQADAYLQGEVALLQTSLSYRRGDLTRVIEFGHRSLELLSPDKLAMRARASMILGMAKFHRGLLQEAQSAETDAYKWGRIANDFWITATALTYLGAILRVRGKLHEAVETEQQAIDLVGYSPAAASPQANLAHVLYELNDLEGVTRNAQSAIELGEIGGAPGARHAAYFDLAYTHLAQGDATGAQAMMDKSDETVRHPMIIPTFRANHMAQHATFALRQGDLDSARDWVNRMSACGAEPSVYLCHVPARLLIAEGRKAAARKQLRMLYGKALKQGAQGVIIALLVCQALAAGTPAQALTFLSEALKIAESKDYVRTFVDEGRLLAPLLRQAVVLDISPSYAARLLTIIEAEDRQRKIRREEIKAFSFPSGLLSKREREVLRLLAEGYSNQEIAARLFVSLNTAKAHVRHILEKFDVANRQQAIIRAKDLELV